MHKHNKRMCKMKKLTLVLLTLITLVQTSLAEEEISVAAFMPLSGPWSPNGDYTHEGIRLAQESLKKDGIKLSVRFEDACFAKDVVKSLKSLTVNSSIEGID